MSHTSEAPEHERPQTPKPVPLFRPEAVEHARTQWLGEFRLNAPLGSTFLSFFLIGVASLGIALLFTLHYTRRITVAGELRSEPGIASVSASQAGQVTALYATEGEHVTAGQALFRITNHHVVTANLDATAAELQALTNDVAAISANSREEWFGGAAQIAALKSKRARIAAQILSETAEIREQRHRIALSAAIVKTYKDLLRRGYTSPLSVVSWQDDLATKTQSLAALQVTLAQTQSEFDDINEQILAIKTNDVDKTTAAQQQIAALDRQRLEIESGAQDVVPAPISGLVTGITLNVGEQVDAGTPALSIVPDGAHLVAVLVGQGEAAGLARIGQPVLLRLSAYPYERFGFLPVTVTAISHAPVAPDLNQDSDRAKYRSFLIYADLTQSALRVEGVNYALKPGMVVSGDLLLDRKSLIEWLVDPVGRFLKSTS